MTCYWFKKIEMFVKPDGVDFELFKLKKLD